MEYNQRCSCKNTSVRKYEKNSGFRHIPFSERKGYRRLKYEKKAIISVCLS